MPLRVVDDVETKNQVLKEFHGYALDRCEAKPTTLKRLSPGDGFGYHMCEITTCSTMKCEFHINNLTSSHYALLM